MVSVISQVKPVQTGQKQEANATKNNQSLLMLTAMRRMFICSIATMEKNHGWD